MWDAKQGGAGEGQFNAGLSDTEGKEQFYSRKYRAAKFSES